jgi:flagellar hook-associated protein 2
MSFSPLVFTGISKFSADFQTILERTVAIASQPIQSLQNEQVNILAQKQLTTTLQEAVASLAAAVSELGAIAASKALSATSSNPSKVTVGSVWAAAPAAYTISEIASLARYASASTAGFADSGGSAVSSNGAVRLVVDGTVYDTVLSPEVNNLEGLRDWINGLGAGVAANILSTGTGDQPYYLSATATATGHKPIALVDDPAGAAANLLASADDGANAEFKINGASVSKASNTINDVVPGVTFTIAGTTAAGESVTLALASSRTRLAGALGNFVQDYNELVGQVDAQIGEDAGLLTGNTLVREAQEALRALAGYQGAGEIASLAQLGIEFSTEGKASLKSETFDTLSDSQVQEAFDFLGSATEGFAGQVNRLTALSDPVSGLIKLLQEQYDQRDADIEDQIEEISARVSELQSSTAQRLQTFDALLAQLESQQTVLDASIRSLQLALFGKNEE